MEVYSLKNQGNENLFRPASGNLTAPPPRQPGQAKDTAKSIQASNSKSVSRKEKPAAQNKQNYPRLLEIAQKVQEKLESMNVSIQFEVNKDSGRIVIKVIDPSSGEVVRKIPPEKLMKSVQFLNEMKSEFRMSGVEIDVKY